jgi:hypothetical protein
MVNTKSLILYSSLNLNWNIIKVILTKYVHSNLIKTSFRIKIQEWKYDKKNQNNNSNYGNKAFLEIKTYLSYIPLKLYVLQWYNCPHPFLFSKDILQKKKQSYVLFKFKWW